MYSVYISFIIYRRTCINRLVEIMPLFTVHMGAMRDVHVDADVDASMPAISSTVAIHSLSVLPWNLGVPHKRRGTARMHERLNG